MQQPRVLGDPRERSVAQRFEAKYFVSEVQAEMVRDYLIPYTHPDTHRGEYPVTSMYLDSEDLTTFRSSLHGERNRYKLRIRGYEGGADKPVFTEVKQRVGRVIRKYRACLRREVLEGQHWAEPISGEFLTAYDNEREQENLMLFSELCARLRAEPKIGVRYMREAYVSSLEEPVRITLDRDVAYAPIPENPSDLWGDATQWRSVDYTPIILEIKFTDSYPSWVQRMIQRFELTRISLAKYVVCIRTMQREGGFLQTGERSYTQWNR